MRRRQRSLPALTLPLALVLVACIEPPEPAADSQVSAAEPATKAASGDDPSRSISGQRLPARYDDSAIQYGAPAGAKVTIVEYADFECKYCKKLADTIDHVAAQHPDEVRVVFKQYPRSGHARAVAAGTAALAAEAQGQGKAYRRLLFKNRTKLSEADLDGYAEAVGIPDMDRFRRERAGAKLLAQLEREREEGAKTGVPSPPYAFVNGRPLKSVPSLEALTELVDEELALSDALLAGGAKQAELYDLYLAYADEQFEALAAEAAPPAPEPSTKDLVADEFYAVYVEGGAILGEDDALVTVIAFADLSQVPAKQLHASLSELHERAPDLRLVFRHVVPEGRDQQQLARTALVAEAKGEFWPWLEALAELEPGASPNPAFAAAASVGLDERELEAELDTTAITARLASDAYVNVKFALDRTPGYFINGRFMPLDTGVEALLAAVGEEREKAEKFRAQHSESEDPYIDQVRGYAASAGEFAPPLADHFRREVELDDLPLRGDRDAAEVHILACADFDCSACRSGRSTLNKLVEEFGAKIALYFRNYPLSIHPTAESAHRAAVAAGEQGQFWAMHDFLFANRERREPADFAAEAERLGLDVARFKADFEAQASKQRVEADYAICRALGVRGAPGYVVNGRLVKGALPYEMFREVIAEELSGGFEAASAL